MTALDDVPAGMGALPRAARLGKPAAALALASATVHALLLDAASLGSLLMVGMALACLPCAWHLWRHPTTGVWGATAAVDGGMLLLHAQMLADVTHSAHGTSGSASRLMWTAAGLVTSQLVLAGAAALRR